MLVAVLRIPGQNDEPREELRVVEQKKQESFRQDIAATKTNPRARRIFLSSNRPVVRLHDCEMVSKASSVSIGRELNHHRMHRFRHTLLSA